jgi:hypothetical protein
MDLSSLFRNECAINDTAIEPSRTARIPVEPGASVICPVV